MPTAYDTLKIERNKCPAECRRCEEACAQARGGGVLDLSRIKTDAPQGDFHNAWTCVQCSEPMCLEACSAGAIEKNPDDGIVRVDESECISCELCIEACPYGGIYFDPETQIAFKCDRCDGNPKCVEACPYGILTYVKNSPALSYLDEEDYVAPGISACPGCLAELALRFSLRILGKNTITFGAPGCAVAWFHGYENRAGTSIAHCYTLLTNVASTMSGVWRHFKKQGRDDVNVVAYVGDGATVDIGFQALSGAAERGEKLIYICYDNEGYMNTGVQRSGSTSYGSRTATTPVGSVSRGKERNSKYMPLLMLFHDIPYVATASIAYPEDYAQKLVKAMSVKDGLSYIHLFLPCLTGWGFPQEQGLDISRLAVETNHFPLWEAVDGKVRITYPVANRKPIQEYTKQIGKYSHLTPQDLEQIQAMVDERYNKIVTLLASE